MPTITEIGTAISEHSATCSRVPRIACHAPPPGSRYVRVPTGLVNQPEREIACHPLLITVHSSHTSGISATPNASVTSTVANWFLAFRTVWLVERAGATALM